MLNIFIIITVITIVIIILLLLLLLLCGVGDLGSEERLFEFSRY